MKTSAKHFGLADGS